MRCLNNTPTNSLARLLNRYQLHLELICDNDSIPYSFWGAPEAGRHKSTLFARVDTPIHSILHEAAHYICMTPNQRESPFIDAKGSAVVESACCYLQIILADYIPGLNRYILMHDMDRWGYSFRLGSTARWFFADSDDALKWLLGQQILLTTMHPSWQLRQIR